MTLNIKSNLSPDGGTREQILAVATRLFADRGYRGTSLQAIADEVGIRKPSLLYHFKSKVELRERVLDALLARWQEVVPQVMRSATSGERRFEAALEELVGFFREDPARARLLMREMLDRPEEIEVLVKAHLGHWIALVTGYIRMGQQEGLIYEDLDPDAYVAQVVGMILTTIAASNVTGGMLSSRSEKQQIDHRASLDRTIKEMVRMARFGLFIHNAQ